MPKVPSNRTRVSPYPLRSTRTQKEPIEAQGPSQWEDVLKRHTMPSSCGALHPLLDVMLTCATRVFVTPTVSSSTARKNMNRVTKVMNCPYCRGEVYEALKVQSGGRYRDKDMYSNRSRNKQ
ncbi:hypothetical protein Bca4012_052348 [Brassica carinata]